MHPGICKLMRQWCRALGRTWFDWSCSVAEFNTYTFEWGSAWSTSISLCVSTGSGPVSMQTSPYNKDLQVQHSAPRAAAETLMNWEVPAYIIVCSRRCVFDKHTHTYLEGEASQHLCCPCAETTGPHSQGKYWFRGRSFQMSHSFFSTGTDCCCHQHE